MHASARQLRIAFATLVALYLLPLGVMVLMQLAKAALIADPAHAIGTMAQVRFWSVIVLTIACVGSVAACGWLVAGSWRDGGDWLRARPFWLKAIGLLAPANYVYGFINYLAQIVASQRVNAGADLVRADFWSTHYLIGGAGLAWSLLVVVLVALALRLPADDAEVGPQPAGAST